MKRQERHEENEWKAISKVNDKNVFWWSLDGLGSLFYKPTMWFHSILVVVMQYHFLLKRLIRYPLFGKYSPQEKATTH